MKPQLDIQLVERELLPEGEVFLNLLHEELTFLRDENEALRAANRILEEWVIEDGESRE